MNNAAVTPQPAPGITGPVLLVVQVVVQVSRECGRFDEFHTPTQAPSLLYAVSVGKGSSFRVGYEGTPVGASSQMRA